MTIRKTEWVVAPNAQVAQHRAMVDGRVITRKLFIFGDRDEALAAAGRHGERVFEFTYSLLPVERPAPSTRSSAPR